MLFYILEGRILQMRVGTHGSWHFAVAMSMGDGCSGQKFCEGKAHNFPEPQPVQILQRCGRCGVERMREVWGVLASEGDCWSICGPNVFIMPKWTWSFHLGLQFLDMPNWLGNKSEQLSIFDQKPNIGRLWHESNGDSIQSWTLRKCCCISTRMSLSQQFQMASTVWRVSVFAILLFLVHVSGVGSVAVTYYFSEGIWKRNAANAKHAMHGVYLSWTWIWPAPCLAPQSFGISIVSALQSLRPLTPHAMSTNSDNKLFEFAREVLWSTDIQQL